MWNSREEEVENYQNRVTGRDSCSSEDCIAILVVRGEGNSVVLLWLASSDQALIRPKWLPILTFGRSYGKNVVPHSLQRPG